MLPSFPNPINLPINQLIGYLILNVINARKLGDSFHYCFHSKCIIPGSTTVKNPKVGSICHPRKFIAKNLLRYVWAYSISLNIIGFVYSRMIFQPNRILKYSKSYPITMFNMSILHEATRVVYIEHPLIPVF